MNIYDNLNPNQLRAVKHGKGPLLVVACPGSGKTKCLTHRIAHLIYTMCIPPSAILATTFTNKAADEMRDRLIPMIGPKARSVWVGTVHSTCNRLLRDCGSQKVGLKDNKFSIYDPSKAERVVRQVVDELAPAALKATNDPIGLSDLNASSVQSAIEEAKEKGMKPETFAARSRIGGLILPYYREYDRRLRDANAVDFADLQLLAVDLLQRDKQVLEAVQKRFQCVLVDEFQDTNDIQAELFGLLAGGYRNITVTGDLDQAVYSFRYANPKHIRNFEKQWPNATVITLDTNYRSTSDIVSAAASVINNNDDRFQISFKPVRPQGGPVQIVAGANDDAVALMAAQVAVAHYSYGIPLSEIAVLYRYHRYSRALESAFRLKNIPYKVVGGIPFYERKEIADLLAWLTLLVNPCDTDAFLRAAKVPPRGVGNTTLQKVLRLAQEARCLPIQMAENMTGLQARQLNGLHEFAALYKQFRLLGDDPDLLATIVSELGYIEHLNGQKDDTTNRVLNVTELIETYYRFASQIRKAAVPDDSDSPVDVQRFRLMTKADNPPEPQTIVELFMEQVLLQKGETEGEDADVVRLSTIHAAKGMEFQAVVVVGCEQGTMPPARSFDDSGDLEEERRVFYVAMTRAKDYLYLMRAREGLVFSSDRGPTMVHKETSQFLHEAMAGGAVEVSPGQLLRPRGLPWRVR